MRPSIAEDVNMDIPISGMAEAEDAHIEILGDVRVNLMNPAILAGGTTTSTSSISLIPLRASRKAP